MTKSFTGTLILKRRQREESTLAIIFGRGAISAWAVGPGIDAPLIPQPRGVSDGRWHHVALVREGSTMWLYFDGQEVDSRDGVPVLSSASPWSLGFNPTYSPHRTVIDAEYCRIRYSGVVRYRYPFKPRTDYRRDKFTVFLE